VHFIELRDERPWILLRGEVHFIELWDEGQWALHSFLGPGFRDQGRILEGKEPEALQNVLGLGELHSVEGVRGASFGRGNRGKS
jgi:hypothetical protein